MIYTKKDIFWGGILLVLSDGIAALTTDQLTLTRVLGMLIIGSTLYAFEIPNFFAWIEKITSKYFEGFTRRFIKTIAVVIFFNPIWIFRHFAFIYILLGEFELINHQLFLTASISYLFNIPISIVGNYIIQNKLPLDWRFVGSSVFSFIMTIYYSMSPAIFGALFK